MFKNYDEKGTGAGLFDVQLSYNKVSRETIAKYGDFEVTQLELRRHPIPSAISDVLKFVTGNKVPFDELYHLSIVVTVKGTKVIIEKNEVVNISANFSTSRSDDHITLSLNGKFTISEMLEKTRLKVGDEVFFSYSAFGNNCQNFIKMNLESVGEYTKEAADFVYQDLTELVKETPVFAQKLANGATHIAALWSKFTGGNENFDKNLTDDLLKFCKDHDITDIDQGFDLWYSLLSPRVKNLIK